VNIDGRLHQRSFPKHMKRNDSGRIRVVGRNNYALLYNGGYTTSVHSGRIKDDKSDFNGGKKTDNGKDSVNSVAYKKQGRVKRFRRTRGERNVEISRN